nr:hypothetical transcript [Hymenolepis microstoma]
MYYGEKCAYPTDELYVPTLTHPAFVATAGIGKHTPIALHIQKRSEQLHLTRPLDTASTRTLHPSRWILRSCSLTTSVYPDMVSNIVSSLPCLLSHTAHFIGGLVAVFSRI